MKAKLIVEGKEFPIEIQDPELQKLLSSQKKTGYERVDAGQKYWIQNITYRLLLIGQYGLKNKKEV